MDTYTTTKATTPSNTCDFCQAEEGKPRPVGQFIVELKPVTVEGAPKQACQSCLHKHPALWLHVRNREQGAWLHKLLAKFSHAGFMSNSFTHH